MADFFDDCVNWDGNCTVKFENIKGHDAKENAGGAKCHKDKNLIVWEKAALWDTGCYLV